MSLLGSLGFGRNRLPEDKLLAALLEARRRGDMQQFAKLCHDHVDVIVAAIPLWKTRPNQQTTTEEVDEYIQTIGTAGQLLRDAGHPQLWDELVGNPDDNPIVVWRRKIDETISLANAFRYDEAAELLLDQLIDSRQLRGSTVGRLQALSQGQLGHLRFGAGKVDLALEHYEQALHLCREQNDQDGVRTYLGYLYESQRYLGRNGPAADYAQELAQAWDAAGNQVSAQRFSRLSQLVRDGEPLLRVVARCDENVIELDEVEEFQRNMKVVFHYWRNRRSLPGATKRVERGKELAWKRQYDEALELFREAAQVDPYEPDAHYQAGMVLCEQQLYLQAVDEYEVCESLAPGWFYCRSDLWVARQLALGVIPHEVFLGLRFLQHGPPYAMDPMEVVARIRPQADALPLFGLLFGALLADAGRPKEAAERWREALQGEGDSDVRSRLLLSLSAMEEDVGRKRQMLQEATELNGNLIAAATAALSLRFSQYWTTAPPVP